MPDRDLDHLAKTVKARRLELSLARRKAAALAGISKDTWQRVEDGKPVREMNYAKIDPVLGWAPGSSSLVAAGGTPVPAEHLDVDGGVTVARPLEEDRAARAERIVQSATIAVTDLDAPGIRELSARIIEDLKRDGII